MTASMKLTLQGPFAMGVLRQPYFKYLGQNTLSESDNRTCVLGV